MLLLQFQAQLFYLALRSRVTTGFYVLSLQRAEAADQMPADPAHQLFTVTRWKRSSDMAFMTNEVAQQQEANSHRNSIQAGLFVSTPKILDNIL